MKYSAYAIERGNLIRAIRALGPGFDVRLHPSLEKGEKGPGESIVKTFMFPQPEVLFQFKKGPRGAEDVDLLVEPSPAPKSTVLFGIRPCDARSIYLNGLAYEEDSYFKRRLEETVICGYLCTSKLTTCFCERVGTGPKDTRHMDIVIREGEEGPGSLLIYGITDRGIRFLKETLKTHLISLGAEELGIDESESTFEVSQGGEVLERLLGSALLDLYNAPFWDRVKDACLNCGICTFRCPTCYCFDIQDETLGTKGRRIRYWDSCMFPLFTQHASGHNPRGQKVFRVRNRFMHKLKYFPDRFGAISCVGCGRCVRECPVNIDIREVLDSMLEVNAQ